MRVRRERAALDPRVARSRAAILEAASRQFLAHGYLAANVDEIAAEARVSKRTIYNIFGGKEQLFREILSGSIETAERFARQVAGELGEAADVEAELTELAVLLAQTVVSERIVTLRRLLIGEAARFPELAREYYGRAPGRVMAAIAEGLARLDRRGLLRVENPRLASEHFAFLAIGASLDRALFVGVEDAPPAGEIADRAREGVAAFVRAYRPTREPTNL